MKQTLTLITFLLSFSLWSQVDITKTYDGKCKQGVVSFTNVIDKAKVQQKIAKELTKKIDLIANEYDCADTITYRHHTSPIMDKLSYNGVPFSGRWVQNRYYYTLCFTPKYTIK